MCAEELEGSYQVILASESDEKPVSFIQDIPITDFMKKAAVTAAVAEMAAYANFYDHVCYSPPSGALSGVCLYAVNSDGRLTPLRYGQDLEESMGSIRFYRVFRRGWAALYVGNDNPDTEDPLPVNEPINLDILVPEIWQRKVNEIDEGDFEFEMKYLERKRELARLTTLALNKGLPGLEVEIVSVEHGISRKFSVNKNGELVPVTKSSAIKASGCCCGTTIYFDVPDRDAGMSE